MGRIGCALLLGVAGSLFGGCTSLLARQGDPDLTVLQFGAHRADIEKEIGHPKVTQELEEGRYVALYIVKLGAPKNPDAKGESLTYVGQGAGATLASGAFGKVVNSLAASGGRWGSGATSNAAVALTIGVAVWGVSEFAGTVRELARLSQRRKHQLEIVYDDRHRMLMHELRPVSGGRLPDRSAYVRADTVPRRAR